MGKEHHEGETPLFTLKPNELGSKPVDPIYEFPIEPQPIETGENQAPPALPPLDDEADETTQPTPVEDHSPKPPIAPIPDNERPAYLRHGGQPGVARAMKDD